MELLPSVTKLVLSTYGIYKSMETSRRPARFRSDRGLLTLKSSLGGGEAEITQQAYNEDSAGGEIQRVAVTASVKAASAMIAMFCLLNAVDAYTTEVGLSNGGREINAFSAYFIASFGVEGYVIGKVAVSLAFAVVAIVVWRSWHKMNEHVFDFYLVLSLALLAGAIAPVLNNLIVLMNL